MYIQGYSEKDYNFNGILMSDNIEESEFYNKQCLIVICYFKSNFPLGSVNYILQYFDRPLQGNELNTLIEKVHRFFQANVENEFPSYKPNYIAYYIEDSLSENSLSEVYQDIIDGHEYRRTFKMFE